MQVNRVIKTPKVVEVESSDEKGVSRPAKGADARDKCPLCRGNKVIGIPGKRCSFCDGKGTVPSHDTDIHDERHPPAPSLAQIDLKTDPALLARMSARASPSKAEGEGKMNDKILKVAVDRFLAWRLPATFRPDCGISFDGRGKDAHGFDKGWPVGTNLFTAEEARAMFEHCLAYAAPAEGEVTTGEAALDDLIDRTEHGADCRVRWGALDSACDCGLWEVQSAAKAANASLRAKLAERSKELIVYGDHAQHCFLMSGRSKPNDHCDCGFDSARQSAQAASQPSLYERMRDAGYDVKANLHKPRDDE